MRNIKKLQTLFDQIKQEIQEIKEGHAKDIKEIKEGHAKDILRWNEEKEKRDKEINEEFVQLKKDNEKFQVFCKASINQKAIKVILFDLFERNTHKLAYYQRGSSRDDNKRICLKENKMKLQGLRHTITNDQFEIHD